MPLVPDVKNVDVSVKRAIQGLSNKLGYTGHVVHASLTLNHTGIGDQLTLSKVCTAATGLNVLRVTGLQTDDTALTGTLRGAYIDVSNGSTAATGTIRAMELKARTEAPGDTGNDVAVLEGLSISADSKAHSVTTMRAAEFILDGKTGGTITEAVGLRIANNLQADKATTSYGLQIYRDSFDYTADIDLTPSPVITANGTRVLKFDTISLNTIIGQEAGNSLTGVNNTFLGYRAGYSATGINNIVLVGHQAGYNLTSSITADEIRSVLIGFQAGYNLTTGEKNTVIGNQALLSETTGEDNTVVGHVAGYNQVGIDNSILFGKAAGYFNIDGVQNTYIGNEAGRGVETKSSNYNVAVGYRALYTIGTTTTGADFNTAIGYEAGLSLTTGGDNVFIGVRAGRDTTDAQYNFALGTHALLENETGDANVCVGHEAGKSTAGVSFSSNILLGYRAGYRLAANSNIMIGHQTGYDATTLHDSILIGYRAGYNLTTLDDNVMIGKDSGYLGTTADGCTYLGYQTGYTATTAARRICIGHSAGFYDTNSDRFILDNQKRANAGEELTNALMYGIMAAAPASQSLRINAALTVSGIVQATDFAKTGWPVTPGVTLSFVGGTTRTFTVTDDDSAYYYIDGVKYTLGENKTVVIDDLEGLWYIYFDGATLTASQTIWSFIDEDKVLVGYLYWARDVGTPANGKAIFVGYELHSFHMSGAIHARLHYTGGARWETGLLVADAGSEDVNISAGDIWDEDLNIPITDGAGSALFEQVLSPAQLPIYYRDGASAWRIFETNEKAIATDAGYVDISDDLKYNKLNGTWANATVGLNNYVAYWVVATNEQTEPVALIMGQRFDNKLSEAKENNIFGGLSLTGLPFEEMVVLARLILKDTGSGVFYTLEEVLDLRALNIGGNITSPLITQHAGLGGLNWANAGHTFDMAVDFNAQNISNIGTVGCGVITQSGATLAATYQPLDDVLTDLAALTAVADNEFIVGTGAGTYAHEGGATARTSIGLGTGDSPTFTGLTLTNAAVIGSNSVVFQPTTNSTTFFQVLDADGGTPIFNVDSTNERVGIGTTAPNASLEVKGAKPAGNIGGFQSGMFHVTGSGTAEFSNSVITGHSAFNGNTQLWYLGSTTINNDDIAFINRQNAAMHFYTNNASRMTIDAAGGVSCAGTFESTGVATFTAGIELGHATDTTITRASAGNLNIEGNLIYRASGIDVPIGDGGTGQSTAQLAINALTAVSGATNEHVLTKDTTTGNATWKAAAAGGGYVDRGNATDFDFEETDLTMDATWRDLDLSAVVGTNAALIHFRVYTSDNGVGSRIIFRENGNTDSAYNRAGCRIVVVTAIHEFDFWVVCDSSGIIEYNATAGMDRIAATIAGWILL